MQSKTLLLALSAAAFSSCSTAYKTGQTPDDVYYSPARSVEKEYRNNERNTARYYTPATDYEIVMGIRDYRWREFRDDYSYRYSPYNYATCNSYSYGYYYNPYYYPWAIYTGKITYTPPVNTTPRMVNLEAYKGYNTTIATGKTTGSLSWSNPANQYNNSNRSNSYRTERRDIYIPSGNTSSPSNNSRNYSPASSGNSSGSGNSSSGNSSGSVSRPGRGG